MVIIMINDYFSIGRDEGFLRITDITDNDETLLRLIVSLVRRPPKSGFYSTWYIFEYITKSD